MTPEEKEQLSGLLAWRKGVLPTLRRVPELEATIASLTKRISALEKKDGRPVAQPKVVKPKQTTAAEVALAMAEYFDEANEGDGEWFTPEEVIKALNVSTTPRSLGQVLGREMDIHSVVRRDDGRVQRKYYLKRVSPTS